MKFIKHTHTPYSLRPFAVYFLVGLLLVNFVAVFKFNPFYIGSFLSFLYIVITPGFLLLPFLIKKRLPPVLGTALSIALSLFVIMFTGLVLNTLLPFFKIHEPLAMLPVLITFDVLIYTLLIFNFKYKKISPFEFHDFDFMSWFISGLSFLLPVLACFGSVVLNNGGESYLTLFAIVLIVIIVLLVLFRKKINPSIYPIVLYMISLAFLLMNSMRGWFITGHDILLEYNVFTLTNDAHRWSMAFYQDPYNACLSLTIFPTYLQSLIHVNTAYIFKFFIQFIGALPIVIVYYLSKQYVSEKIAFLVSFLYVTFPTSMVDMAFLNRQGVAFLFFSSVILTLFNTEHFNGKTKTLLLFMLGTGMVFSHYSTSYVAVPVLIGAYIINKIMRVIIKINKPNWLSKTINKLGNIEMYRKQVLLTLPFVLGLLVIMILWSTVITKTSKSFSTTIQQIVVNLKDPFNIEEQTGPAKYSIVKAQQPSAEELFNRFVENGIDQHGVLENQSAFYPLAITEAYPSKPVLERFSSITPLGEKIQSLLKIDLSKFFNNTKQFYALLLQVLLLIGLVCLVLGYGFKNNILNPLPVEYIALSVSGILVMVGQTILPANVIEYGLLRLFQQNLIFLSLPIFLGLFYLTTLITKNHTRQLILCVTVLLSFFVILSGLIPQLTGGARPLLSLNNGGLYYDSYYTHAEEVASIEWIAQFSGSRLPVQAAHFSDIKMLAYGRVAPHIELLPETTKKNSFVYLNYDNVKTSNVLEIIYGDVVYYYFPMNFLRDHKNLIYSNGGSEIYR
jgi:uncharacterized membrane protein